MKELERRFLLREGVSIEDVKNMAIGVLEIEQGYVFADQKLNARVRVNTTHTGKTAYFCIKYMNSAIDRDEYEFSIPLVVAKEILDRTPAKLEKTRYVIDDCVVVDKFNDGDIVVEVEYEKEIKIHDICGQEVTGIIKFSNINKALSAQTKKLF